MDEFEQVQGADWTFSCSLEASFDTGRMEEMEAK